MIEYTSKVEMMKVLLNILKELQTIRKLLEK